MKSHPYRQKTAAPYPIDEIEAVQAAGGGDAGVQPEPAVPKALDDAHLLNKMPLSPRFTTALAESVRSSDHLDLAKHARASGPNVSTLTLPSQTFDLPPAATHSHSLLNGLNPLQTLLPGTSPFRGTLPYYGSHLRLVSLSLLFFQDRNDAGLLMAFNQNLIQQHLGASGSLHLMPRMKTIELYRKNAKKLSDPAVLFQYAQYMLQTALLFEPESGGSLPEPQRRTESNGSLENVLPSDPTLRRSLLKEAFHYLKRLADKGYVDAQYLLGDAYSLGAFGKVDNREAFLLFLQAAKRGHTECAFRTAHCYEEGLGTGRDARKGIDFLKMAALKNHPAAMYKLGMYFFYGRMGVPDTPVNKKLGIKWLERALNVATELTAAAPYELGKIQFTGYLDVLIKDEKYALELFAQAAALGHIGAAAALGHHYEIGDVVPADANLLIHYYTKAALGGHAPSMLAMCAWYMVGAEPHLPKDELEAFEWAKRAALCGDGKAQFVLANFYDKGIGCQRSEPELQHWYMKAAENGQEKALARLKDQAVAAEIVKKNKKKRVLSLASLGDQAAREKDCVIM